MSASTSRVHMVSPAESGQRTCGISYTSKEFTEVLDSLEILQSVGRTGTRYYNAMPRANQSRYACRSEAFRRA